MLLHRKNVKEDVTDDALAEIDVSILDFHAVHTRTIAKGMKSQGQTIKYHRLSHVTGVMRRLGQLKEYDAQFYESANRLEKALYKRTPGRQVNEQHLDGMVVKQRTQAIAKARNTFDPDAGVRNKRSAYIAAAESGENTLVSTRIPIHTNGFTPNTVPAAVNWLERTPDWLQLRFAVAAHCGLRQDVDNAAMPTIHVAPTAVLAAALPWETDGSAELQTVRAVPTFHGKPYYDSVEIQVARNTTAFAQLRLLFSLRGASGEMQDLAFVRMYSRVRQDAHEIDMLSEHGCVPLSWARAVNTVRGTGAYRLITLNTIKRRVYIVPDFTKPVDTRFHLCAFKWTRRPVANYTG